jgi:hypothetical protein
MLITSEVFLLRPLTNYSAGIKKNPSGGGRPDGAGLYALGRSLAVFIAPYSNNAILLFVHRNEVGRNCHLIALTTPMNVNGAEKRLVALVVVNFKSDRRPTSQFTTVNRDYHFVVQPFDFYMLDSCHCCIFTST